MVPFDGYDLSSEREFSDEILSFEVSLFVVNSSSIFESQAI